MKRPTDLPKRNVTLLQTTMRFIELNPDKHNQRAWVNECGTAFCYAGHAALLAGVTEPPMSVTASYDYWGVNISTLESCGVARYEDLNAGTQIVDEFAAQQLGLTEEEASTLFEADRTVKALRALVDALCNGAWIDNRGYIYLDEADALAPSYVFNGVWVDEWLVSVGAEKDYE